MTHRISYDNNYLIQERQRILLKGYYYGLPGTNGSLKSNLIVWVKNEHPILSLCFSHEDQIFTKCDRSMILIASLCWSFMITVFFYNVPINTIVKTFLISFFAMIYETYLKFLVTCPWVLKCNEIVKFVCCVTGYCIFLQLFMYSFIWVFIAYLYIQYDSKLDNEFITLWFMSEGISYVTWFSYNIPRYLMFYNYSKNTFQQEFPSLLNIDGVVDEDYYTNHISNTYQELSPDEIKRNIQLIKESMNNYDDYDDLDISFNQLAKLERIL